MANLPEGRSVGKNKDRLCSKTRGKDCFEMYKLLESHQEARKPKFGK